MATKSAKLNLTVLEERLGNNICIRIATDDRTLTYFLGIRDVKQTPYPNYEAAVNELLTYLKKRISSKTPVKLTITSF